MQAPKRTTIDSEGPLADRAKMSTRAPGVQPAKSWAVWKIPEKAVDRAGRPDVGCAAVQARKGYVDGSNNVDNEGRILGWFPLAARRWGRFDAALPKPVEDSAFLFAPFWCMEAPMVFATAGPSSCWTWLVLFGSFGLGYVLRDWLSRYRRRRWRHRHDWIEAYRAGLDGEEGSTDACAHA